MGERTDFLTIAEAAKLLETKQLSPVELVAAKLERIEALNPQLDAFVTLTADRAMERARRAETEIAAGRYLGPLHGIPFGLKDIYDTAGILTTGHSRVFQNNIPREDATTTAMLFKAGAILLGKLSTHEFAHGGPSFDLPWPPARNPWNPEHVTGGTFPPQLDAFVTLTADRAMERARRAETEIAAVSVTEKFDPAQECFFTHNSNLSHEVWRLTRFGARFGCNFRGSCPPRPPNKGS